MPLEVIVLAAGQGQTIAVGSPAWHAWLDAAHTTTFRFVHPLATLTVRKCLPFASKTMRVPLLVSGLFAATVT